MIPEPTKEEQEIIDLTKAVLEAWCSRDTREFEHFLSYVHEDASFIGTGPTELGFNKKMIEANERQGMETITEPIGIEFLFFSAKLFGNTAVSTYQYNLTFIHDGQEIFVPGARGSLIFIKENNAWKYIHNHVSLPWVEQKKGDWLSVEELKARNQELENIVAEKTAALTKEKEKTESLLYNILPVEVAKELLEKGAVKPVRFDEVSILFTDFKEFTNIVATIPTRKLISELNELFSEFDDIMEAEGIEKIQTVGDAYLAASGLPEEAPDHAIRCVRAGKKMIDFLKQRNKTSAIKWKIRIGIHSGPIAAGVVGKKKFAYDIFGDTINIASRIETAGEEGKINVSAYTYDLIKEQFPCEYRGKISAKGKGDLDMYFVK